MRGPDQRAVLTWGAAERRDLPWRRTRDPWSVLVAEVMLQQTQVARVIPRYTELLAAYPTATACAAASAGDVVRLWSGLGYNGRALRLHAASVIVANELDGRLPDTLIGLCRLPGVGPYTARAVLAFAFDADVAVVDTNVARVMARWHGRRLRSAEVQALADAALPAGDGWGWNQSLLDLGATVCTARRPDCAACPLRASCSWRTRGHPGPDPARGSAHTGGRQSRFDGSDRQGRGRLVSALALGAVSPADLPSTMGWPNDPARAESVAATLVADGLAVRDGAGAYSLP